MSTFFRVVLSYRGMHGSSKLSQGACDLPNRLRRRAAASAEEPCAGAMPADDGVGPVRGGRRSLPAMLIRIPRLAAIGINQKRFLGDAGDRLQQPLDEPRR